MAYAVLAEGRSSEELEELNADIGMTESAEVVAMTELNAHRVQMGLEPLPMPSRASRNGDEEFR